MVPDYYAMLGVEPGADRATLEAALARSQPIWSSGTRNPKNKHTYQSYLDQIPALRQALLGDPAPRPGEAPPAEAAPPAPPADVLAPAMRRQTRVALEHPRRRDLYDALGLMRDAPMAEIVARADAERQRWMHKAQVTAEKTAWLEV